MLEADYLVIGSGAMGMAFVDTLLTETDASIIIVDMEEKPGGHWNHAYPFVTLHQPSQFYGVSSRELSDGKINTSGLNQGMSSLATGEEIMTYYSAVMNETFLPSGRVQYFPLSKYTGNYQFESLTAGEKFEVKVNKKLVDCSYLKTSVPSRHVPSFKIADEVRFMPLNDLPKIENKPDGYVIIGGGKTGIDACLWLLENRVNPDEITWIVSRDAWLINRETTQATMVFFDKVFGGVANQFEAAAKAKSIPDLFERLERDEVLLRLDSNVTPQMFHGATVSKLELEQLRRIKNVVRHGRVKSIETDQIVFENTSIPTSANMVHVDCSASAITNLETTEVFKDGLITPQTVRSYQPVFSAALIAFVEANFDDDHTKNKICNVVPLPNADTSWLTMTIAQMTNQFAWSKHKKLRKWLSENRLNGFGSIVASIDKTDEKKMAIMNKLRSYTMPAMINLQQLITELNEPQQAQIKNPQFQVDQRVFFKNCLQEIPESEMEIADGEILVQVEQFAYTSNNITYAVAGDQIGYWQFFPAVGKQTDSWGVIPVWGIGKVVESNVEEIPIGDKLFGYFPPAKFLKMKPGKIAPERFMESSEHRLKLPSGYNLYRRLNNERSYNEAFDNELMMLFPLHLTSFCIWDAMKEKDWHGAQQVVILSASSKTSTGLGYALKDDETAPSVIGFTSPVNLETVENLELYDQCFSYDDVLKLDATIPTLIVDMSGNAKVLAALHKHLGDNMRFTSNVGITHWENARPQPGIITERSQFFFAPGHIQKRMKEWGPKEFNAKTTGFMIQTAMKTKSWLKYREVNGLQELAAIHPSVCMGKIPSNEGLIVKV